MNAVISPPRFVAGIVVREHPDHGVSALLLRQWYAGEIEPGVRLPVRSDLPGGLLLDREFPVTGIRRLLLASNPIDAGYAASLAWSWVQSCAVVPRGEGPIGTGFVLALRVPDHKAAGLISKDGDAPGGVLRWCELARVREWMTFCPDGVLAVLVAMLTARDARLAGGKPIHQDVLWPDCRAGLAQSPAA